MTTNPVLAPNATNVPVAELRRAIKSFGATAPAVDCIDLALHRGDRLAVIGESGSGKSTIARLVLGLLHCDSGSAHVLGEDWQSLSAAKQRAMRARLGMVFQEPVEALNPRSRVHQIIAEPLQIHCPEIGKEEIATRVEGAMRQVHLDTSFASSKPHQLSGGQAQRVAIARAIINNPEFLVLDEPTSALDVSVQAHILELLEELAEARSMTWIFITHDLGVAAEVCDLAVVVNRGAVVETGTVQDVLERPTHSYTQQLVQSSLKVEFS